MRRETLGSLHPNTLRTVKCLGRLLKAKGDTEAAEPLLREVEQAKQAKVQAGNAQRVLP